MILAFALVNLAWKELEGIQAYAEPLVGGITWDNLDKGRDTRAFGLFLAMSIAGTLGIGGLLRRLSGAGPAGEVGRALNALIWIALAPSAWWIGFRVAYPNRYDPPYEAAGALLIVLAGMMALWRIRGELTAAHVYDIAGGIALAVPLGAMSGCALALAIGRFSASACDALAGRSWIFAAAGAGIAAIWAAIVAARSRDGASMRTSVFRLLLALQIPLPLLFGTAISPRIMVGADGFPPPYTAWLPIGVGLLASVAWLTLVHRWMSWRRAVADGGLDRVLSPLCLSAVAVFLQVWPAGPPHLIGDHFHVGEQMLPWQQWADFGMIPYVDFIPIHGLMPLLRGLINAVCFQGTAATFFMAEPILYGCSVIATFLAVSSLIGTPGALLVALLVGLSPGYGDRLYFMAPAVMAMVHPRLLAKPTRWMVAWPALVGGMLLYNPSVGFAFTLATAPMGAWMAWRLLREQPRVALRLGLVGAAAIAVACLLTPATTVSRAFLQFLSENARHNQVLHGLPMEMSFGPIPDRLGLSSIPALFQLVRYSWVAVLIAALTNAWAELARPRGHRRPVVIWGSVLIATILLWNSQWALGRIDTTTLSRTGMQSIAALTVLLPVLIILGRSAAASAPLLAGLPLVLGLIAPPETDSILGPLADRPLLSHRLPEGAALVEGAEQGMPNIGRVLNDPHFVVDEVAELKSALDPLLRPGETFLDLTNRSAYYYYLGLQVPALYSANFIAGSAEMQARMIDRLRDQPPPVVLIAPAVELGTGPASLRSYHLYRDAVEDYVAVRRGRFTLLVDPARLPEVGPVGSEDQLAILDEVFAPPPLEWVPLSWGRSLRSMESRFRMVAAIVPERLAEVSGADRLPDGDFSPTGPESELVYRIDDLDLDGRVADFLLLDFDYVRSPGTPDAQIDVSWEPSRGHRPGSLTFNAARSHLLVPLGAHPRWLLSEGFRTLRIRVRTGDGFKRFSVSNLRLLQLDPAVE